MVLGLCFFFLKINCTYCTYSDVSCFFVFFQGLLRIHVLEGQNLVPKDNLMGGLVKGKSDPYVKINIGGETFKSHVIKSNLNPTWNEMYEVNDISVVK